MIRLTTRASLLLLAACVAIGVSWALRHPSPAQAQAATLQVTGRVTSGTAGAAVPEGLIVRLIALDGTNASTAAQAATRDGRYALTAAATGGRTYIPHLVYEAIDYFGDPIGSDAATSAPAQRDFLVYATTREQPALTIASTAVTLVAIDRQAHQLGFTREDAIANPGDRVYLGNDDGVTLHLPAPDGTIEASGIGTPEAFRLERGVLAAAVPIRPGALTTVVTRYLVDYDPAANSYRLRVTAALPSERIIVRVPAGYARLRAVSGATAAPDEPAAAGADAGAVLQVVRSSASTPPGGGILVDIVGLSGRLQSNPLTAGTGALAGTAIALAILGGGVFAGLRWGARAS